MKVGKKIKKVHKLPKPIKVDWKPKPIPVEVPKVGTVANTASSGTAGILPPNKALSTPETLSVSEGER